MFVIANIYDEKKEGFMSKGTSGKDAGQGKIIRIDEDRIKSHLGELVRGTVEETLNAMLDAEAETQIGAGRYERNEERKDTRAGHYERNLDTQAGRVALKVPKLRKLTFETQIIERYKRREASVEEALIEMYLAGVSVRRVEDVTEALWGTRVSSGTVSRLNHKIYDQIEEWRMKPIEGEYPFVYLDGISLKRSWGGEIRNISVLVAIGVGADGYRDVLGVAEGAKEDKESWTGFLRYLKDRGLKGVQLVISDKSLGLIEVLGDFFPEARWQRCMVHWYRNVLRLVPKGKSKEVAAMLKAIHAQEDRKAAQAKAAEVAKKLEKMRLKKAAEVVRGGIEETLSYMAYPREYWLRIRTNNPLERIMREIRRRTRVVGAFPDGQSALMLVAARLRHIAGTRWGTKAYLNMKRLEEMAQDKEPVALTESGEIA
jgi:transposase-like protein